MKSIYVLLFLSFSSVSFSQISNGGFEEWEVIDNLWYPAGGWNVLFKDTIHPRFEQSDDRVDGDFSLKFLENVSVDPRVFACYGFLYGDVEFSAVIENGFSLEFYLKDIPRDSMGVPSFFMRIVSVFEGISISNILWENQEVLYDFKKIRIDFEFPPIDKIRIALGGGGRDTGLDGCYAPSTVWLDDLRLITTTPVSETIEIEYQLFPNPTRSVININSDYLWTKVNVYSDLGQLLKSFDFMEEIDISQLKDALYYVDIEWRNGEHTRERVIKR